MAEANFYRNSLVLYKTHPALVKQTGDKLEIALEDGRSVKVRPKDVTLLHPGPVFSFSELQPPAGEVAAAWELLAGAAASTSLAELAELIYDANTPAAAWATWQLLEDGLYFQGSVQSITPRPAAAVTQMLTARAARAAEEQAWREFLARARARRLAPEDRRYLHEVAELALGRQDRSRVLYELGRPQSPENAHTLLLELGYWDVAVDPYPLRLGLPTASPALSLPDLPDEERLDLTHLPAFAIDDEGSQDPDDALSLDPTSGRLWVHVADVAALVAPNSPADLEARSRGANLYLPEGVITMLPSKATGQLGLGLAEVSPALSFGIDLDSAGQVMAMQVAASRVRVTRLTYEAAAGRLDEASLAGLCRLAQIRRARRLSQGAIVLDLPEVKMRVDEDGRVHIRPLPSLESHTLVEEAMLAAGEAVARFAQERKIALPYTTQDPAELFVEPVTGLAGMVARRRTLKPGQQGVTPGPHSGLGLSSYVRASSPLRRYADLLVHQQLRAYLAGGPLLDAQAVLERVAEAEAAAGNVRWAERLARQHWTLVYFLQHPGWRGLGVLVEKAGLRGVALVPELAWETRVHLREDLPLNSALFLTLTGLNLPLLEAYFQVSQTA